MNLEKLKAIIELDPEEYTEDHKQRLLIQYMASEKDIIPKIMESLNWERKSNSELIKDMNLELSRAHTYIDDIVFQNPVKESKSQVSKEFITDKIMSFYVKYKDKVTHCFNKFQYV